VNSCGGHTIKEGGGDQTSGKARHAGILIVIRGSVFAALFGRPQAPMSRAAALRFGQCPQETRSMPATLLHLPPNCANLVSLLRREQPAMRKIRYALAMSLDGYIAGPNGEAGWIVRDPEVNFGRAGDYSSGFGEGILEPHYLVNGRSDSGGSCCLRQIDPIGRHIPTNMHSAWLRWRQRWLHFAVRLGAPPRIAPIYVRCAVNTTRASPKRIRPARRHTSARSLRPRC
jgi:hypothetical protein